MTKPSLKRKRLVSTFILTFLILSTFVLSGFTIVGYDGQVEQDLPPNQGPVAGQSRNLSGSLSPILPAHSQNIQSSVPNQGSEEPESPVSGGSLRLSNVIRNGGFEKNPTSSVATYWEPFNNGGAQFGWYAERWEEAVHSGKSSQLMEIFYVDGFVRNRFLGIQQTVDVIPNANYNLTIHAIMRSDAPEVLRNQGEYALEWGIDFGGREKHYRVAEWHTMPLTEQLRKGSNGPMDDNQHLFFQRVVTTVHTANTDKLSLFIRGVKIEPTGTEVNFNIDDVSLVGPYPAGPAEKSGPPAQLANSNNLPDAGAILPQNISMGALALSGLVLIILAAGAANSLLLKQKM